METEIEVFGLCQFVWPYPDLDKLYAEELTGASESYSCDLPVLLSLL